MDNFLFLEKSKELEQCSKDWGFTKALFVTEDFIFLEGDNQKTLLQEAKEAKRKGKIVICQPKSEEALRFVLEKTPVDIILGMEQIHLSDSFHYLRGGLDQVLCAIAKENKKTFAFSFSDVLHSTKRPQLLARMRFNISLCTKYKIPVIFSNFCREREAIRSAKDILSFFRVICKQR